MFFSCPVARRNEILKSEPNEQYQKKIKDKAIANRITHSYYLLFGREMDVQGDLKKVWVEVELPNTAEFCYWEDGTFSHLKFMVDFRANAAKGLSMSNPGAIFDAMKNGINFY